LLKPENIQTEELFLLVPGIGKAAANPQLPSVELILEVDAEYRRRAQAEELKKIAPRRFGKRVVRGRESECRAFYYLRPVTSTADRATHDPSPPFAAAG